MPRTESKDIKVESSYLKVMVCGDPGTGKSIFASSFPQPMLVFDFAEGALSYRSCKEATIIQFPVTALGWVEFEKELLAVKKEVKEGKYKTVVVDDVSTMCDLAMQRSLQLDPKRNPAGGPLWNVHYQMVRNLVEGRLRQILDFKEVNKVFIAHLDVTTDNETGAIVKVSPLMTGQLSIKVPGLFDEVYYTQTKKTPQGRKYYLQTVFVGFNKARSRISGKESLLPELIENDYNTLIKLIDKEK